MQRRLVTINAVAAEAGVSASTVSRVLNGAVGKIGISPGVSERVHAAAQRLHYAPNHAARSLARRHTGVVTLLLGRISATLGTDIVAGVTRIAARHGYHVNVLFVGAADNNIEMHALTYLRSGVCDGVLVASGSHCPRGPAGDALVELVERGMPVSVVLGRGPSPDVPFVDVDHAGGACLATTHLLGLGHRRIARFAAESPAPDDPCPQAARCRGYLRALDAAGIVADPRWAFGGGREMSDGVEMTRALVERFPDRADRPTGIVALSDQVAIGALRGLYEMGIRVPDEIAVVGMDSSPAAPFATPALTMVEHPRVELGEMAAEALFSKLVGNRAPAHRTIVPMSLVVRESCGAPRRHEWRLDDRADGTPSRSTYAPSRSTCGRRRSTMSFARRVREALERQGVPPGTADGEGYRVEEAPDDLVIVRWGAGDPLNGLRPHRNGDGLATCAAALKRERFLVAPNPFEDADGRFIAVRESSR